MSGALIEFSEVDKRFEGSTGRATLALENFSLRVEEGEFVCLLGPSGCGKSTVLDLLAGFERANGGRVTISGQAVARPGPDRGIVFQEPSLFPWLSVIDNITFVPRLFGTPAAEYRARAQAMLDVMGLRGFEHHAPYELSGGMRQRVAIARAWISDPRMMLMDEPFGALDAQTRVDMQELLLAARERNRSTVLFVTHDVEEALFLADRVVVMTRRPGRVQLDIPVPFARPRDYESLVADPSFGKLKRVIIKALRHDQSAGVDATLTQTKE